MPILPSANMNLPIPVVGLEAGPQYATDVNGCLTIIDAHNHAPGSGVQIDPTGLNIDTDLPINGNNLIEVRTVRFQPQALASDVTEPDDLGCLYEVDDDLYYTDGLGNQIRITQSGSIVGTSGSIGGLVSPASASYVALFQTFVWESGANIPANLDAGAVIFRRVVAGSAGITVQAPLSLTSDYTLILPALPSSQKFMTLDNSGNITATWEVDNSSLEISANTLQAKALGVQTSMLANQSVTQAKLALRALSSTTVVAGGIGVSPSSGAQAFGSGIETDIANNTITITTLGRPVFIGLQSDGTNIDGTYVAADAGGQFNISFHRDATMISTAKVNGGGTTTQEFAPSSFSVIDTPSAGTYVYKARGRNTSANGYVFYARLVVYEL